MDALAPAVELSRIVATGDLRRAGEWLVSHYAADVVSFCRSLVRERELAEDLAQDAFSNAFANLRGFRAEASPRTWLLSIARNRCIDHLRRAKRELWADGNDEAHEPDLHADDAPLPAELVTHKTYVEAALGDLEEGDRALVILRFRHGLEYPELANVFGLREGTVRMRLSRALARMRVTLERREGVDGVAAARARSQEVTAPARRLPVPVAGPAPAPPRGSPGIPPPPAGRYSPPPPFGAAPPPAAMQPPPRSVWATIRRWLLPSASPAAMPFATALAPNEPDVSEHLVGRLDALIATLPER